jgi:16S rRNA A1518/A1519 N6-dimethyltransferase RsmA/KsgA/DIM1 with predicted DNA glycosylase/AP lyase activity
VRIIPFFGKDVLAGKIKQLGLAVDPKLGQNFIIDRSLCARMVSSAEIHPESDVVLEIGPGLGAITEQLIKIRAKLVLVEKDPTCSQFLFTEIKKNHKIDTIEKRQIDFLGKIPVKSPITLVNADILEIPFPENAILISNLPFSMSYAIIKKMVLEPSWKHAIFILQYEVFEHLTSLPNQSHFSAISALASPFLEITMIEPLERRMYYPSPEIDTILVKLTKKQVDFGSSAGYCALVESLFQDNTKPKKEKWKELLQFLGNN